MRRRSIATFSLILALAVSLGFIPTNVSAATVTPTIIEAATLNASGSNYLKFLDEWKNQSTAFTTDGYEVNYNASAKEEHMFSVNDYSVTKDEPFSVKFKFPLFQDGTKTFIDDNISRIGLTLTLYAEAAGDKPLVRLVIWGNAPTYKTAPDKSYTSAELYVYDGNGWNSTASIANIRLVGTATASGEFALTFDNENFFQSEVFGQVDGVDTYRTQSISNWGWGTNTPDEVRAALQKTFAGVDYIRKVRFSMNNNGGKAGKIIITELNGQSLKLVNGGIAFTQCPALLGVKANKQDYVTDTQYNLEILNIIDNYNSGANLAATTDLYAKVDIKYFGNIGWSGQSGTYIDVVAPDGTVKSFSRLNSWTDIPFSFEKMGVNTVNVTVLTRSGCMATRSIKINVGMKDIDFATQDGASIRLSGNTGLRFAAKILKTDYDRLVEVYGQDNVVLGMRIVRGNNAYVDIVAHNVYESEGYICFNGVVTEISADHYNVTYQGSAYLDVTVGNDTVRITVDATDNCRTIAQVAQIALDSGEYAEYEDILNGFIGGSI